MLAGFRYEGRETDEDAEGSRDQRDDDLGDATGVSGHLPSSPVWTPR